MASDEGRRLTLLGLADFNNRNTSIMAEDQEQGVLVDAMREIANIDSVGNDLREDGVVGGGSRLALLCLCEGEDKSLVVAKSL